jgi:hypothetical protein
MLMLLHRNRIPVPFADVRIATVAFRDEGFPVSGIAELLLTNEAEKETPVDPNCADLIVDQIDRLVMKSALADRCWRGLASVTLGVWQCNKRTWM